MHLHDEGNLIKAFLLIGRKGYLFNGSPFVGVSAFNMWVICDKIVP